MINMYASKCGRMRHWRLNVYTFDDFSNGNFFIVLNEFENHDE
jgi:hypothetical protein